MKDKLFRMPRSNLWWVNKGDIDQGTILAVNYSPHQVLDVVHPLNLPDKSWARIYEGHKNDRGTPRLVYGFWFEDKNPPMLARLSLRNLPRIIEGRKYYQIMARR